MRTDYTYMQQYHVLQMIEAFLALADDPERGLLIAKEVVELMVGTIAAREAQARKEAATAVHLVSLQTG